VGIPTSWDPGTPEGLESQLSIRIHKIPVELLHSTELELRKLRRIRTDPGRASALEPRSPPVLRTSPLSLLYKE
jgi:hypothetical protein